MTVQLPTYRNMNHMKSIQLNTMWACGLNHVNPLTFLI
jgi:hypothetical protein